MKSEFTEVWFENGVEITGTHKTVNLPFKRASARALIVRRGDGAILGTLHREGGHFALPGGAIEDGESSAEAVKRELAEEHIRLIEPGVSWEKRVGLDYFEGYRELSIWHIFDVKDASIGVSEENLESRWVGQEEEIWYPFMHQKIILLINQFLPNLAVKRLVVEK
jgi:8-oxo-dGTP pyrophosphatase MutT (NUDIX family)